jgi:hypothetical protein
MFPPTSYHASTLDFARARKSISPRITPWTAVCFVHVQHRTSMPLDSPLARSSRSEPQFAQKARWGTALLLLSGAALEEAALELADSLC